MPRPAGCVAAGPAAGESAGASAGAPFADSQHHDRAIATLIIQHSE
jgi:hypothetical protein